MYAKIKNGVVYQYPYGFAELQSDNPYTNFGTSDVLAAFAGTESNVAGYELVDVATDTAPAYNAQTHCVELSAVPVQIGDAWVLQWVVRAKTADELASDAAALQAFVVTQTQARLDDFARTRNYDGILSACTYATSTVPKFAAEGQYCVTARDQTWATLYRYMAEVEAGTKPMPSGFADVEPVLPVLVWPA